MVRNKLKILQFNMGETVQKIMFTEHCLPCDWCTLKL